MSGVKRCLIFNEYRFNKYRFNKYIFNKCIIIYIYKAKRSNWSDNK
jgi:hypothetical protein